MRIALGLSYNGAGFEGWQSQPSRNTVQDRLEAALGSVADAPVRVVAAGRTDTGVHASAQVCHFDVQATRPVTAWIRGTNAYLPASIAVQWATDIDEAFHARFSAVARSYVYVLYNHSVRPALFANQVGWFHQPLDVTAMQRAASLLIGKHDFSVFRSSECQAAHPVRIMERCELQKHDNYIVFRFTANAFLHHMIRNIVGSLVYVGKGAQRPEWFEELLQARDRRVAAPTFSSAGLYLADVRYPDEWHLPGFAPMMPPLPTS